MALLKQWWLVHRREMNALLTQPLFFILTGIFFFLSAMIYLVMLIEFARGGEGVNVNVTDSVVRPTFHSIHFFLLVQIPLLSMRVFSEDRASGMLDLMQTTSARDWAVVLGKWSATTMGVCLYVLVTAAFPLATAWLGNVEWPVVMGSLLALVLVAGAYSAAGVFFSSLTDSQVVAAVLSYVSLFFLFFAQFFADGWRFPVLQQAMRHFAVAEHVAAVLGGSISPMNIFYFVGLVVVFLFLTARVLEARRWRA